MCWKSDGKVIKHRNNICNGKRHNRGSAIVEVTLIMPVILILMVLFITMLLGGLQQAKTHASLMMEYTDESVIEKTAVFEKDYQVYTQTVELEFVQGYPLHSIEQQIIRSTSEEERIRRWQVFGSLVSE